MKLLSLFFLAIVLFISCNQNNSVERYDCEFVQIDEDNDGLIDEFEKMTMNDCLQNAFSSKSEIENNLIGEWELTGHGEGWITTPSQPCGYVIITEDELSLTFRNATTNINSTIQWELEEEIQNGNTSFILKLYNGNDEDLSVTQFCENHMFVDATPRDGRMYLYTKVE